MTLRHDCSGAAGPPPSRGWRGGQRHSDALSVDV